MRFALLLLCACATTQSAQRAPVFRDAHEVWDDVDHTLRAIECAVVEVEQNAHLAAELVNVDVIAVSNYRLEGCYDHGDDPTAQCYGPFHPPVAYVKDDWPNAWSSNIRYELLCRRLTRLKEGSARRCSRSRWLDEIRPLYQAPLRTCWYATIAGVDPTVKSATSVSGLHRGP